MKGRATPQSATGGRQRESTLQGPPSESLIEQYSLAKILGIWAAAALPMGVLVWGFAPLVAGRLGGPVALPRILIGSLAVGLIWQFVLVMLLVYRERGSLRWPVLKDALWLHSPRSPTTGRVGGRLWLVLIPATLLFAAEGFIPVLNAIPPVAGHDFTTFVQSDTGREFFTGNWVWFALIAVQVVFNTVLGEELLFRGVLLPRMKGAFGRFDWVANGFLFATYHLHMPWAIPANLVDIFALFEEMGADSVDGGVAANVWARTLWHGLYDQQARTAEFSFYLGEDVHADGRRTEHRSDYLKFSLEVA